MNKLIIRCRCSLVALLLIVINGVAASAATPWTVNPADYRYDMSLYLDLSFAEGKMDYAQYDVAAFVGDECRGIAEVLATSEGQSCLYLRARSNSESGEKLTFKYHNKSTDEVLPVEAVSIDFVSNSRLGYPSAPHAVKILFYHDVAISASEGGSVSNVGGRLAEGTSFDVTATADEGYHFVKWADDNTDNPRSIVVAKDDISLKALFEPNVYKLSYSVDGAEYKSYDVAYGTALEAEAAPEKEGYTFSGWSEVPATMPAHDVTISGSFSINSYKAVFKIGDDIIETKTIVYGESIEAATAPEKEGYTFAGWSEIPASMPAHDIEIVGSYTVNHYKLSYVVDGAEYKSYDVAYGTALEAEAAPEKEGYTFSGWNEVPATMPAHDVTISGSFSINSYKAVFKIGDDIIETKTIVYGEAVEAAVAPEKEGHTFAGWSEIPASMPAHDIEIVGSYTVNHYTLSYVVDGSAYKSYDVAYGTALEAEGAPEKEGYTFSGWSEVPATMPAHDVTISGSFSINSYKAVFKIGDDIIETKTIVYGEAVEAAVAPEKEGYTFAGWGEMPTTMPAHDIEIVGSYTVNHYTLSYVVDGSAYKSYDVAYGTALEAEGAPEKEGYTFSGWSEIPATMPAHNVEVSGTFCINSYKLTVYVDDEVYMDTIVLYGEPISVAEPTVGEGRTFAGWDIEIPATMPAHDLTIHGTTTLVSLISKVFGKEDKLTICDINGRLLYKNVKAEDVVGRLHAGLYIVNGKKVLLKAK